MGKTFFFSLFFLLLSLSLFFGLGRGQIQQQLQQQQQSDECFPFLLDNECTHLFPNNSGGVLVSEIDQTLVWEDISLSVSNVRMMDRGCRRPMVRYLCLEAFGSCLYPDLSQFLEEEWRTLCEDCGGAIELLSPPGNCSFSPSPSPSPSPFSTPIFEDVAIPVVTCLSDDREEIPCCPEPFEQLTNEECGVACYHYLAPKDTNDFLEIYCFTLAWLTSFVLFLVISSLFSNHTHLIRFPNYLFVLILVLTNLTQHVFVICVYFGGMEDYVCGDNDHFFEIFPEFARSNRCVIQAFLFCFFLLLSSYWEMVLAFIMMGIFFRATHPNSRLADLPLFDSRKKQLFLHFAGLVFCLSFSLPILIGSYKRDYDPSDPIIGFFFISCVEYAGGFSLVFAVPLVVVSVFCALFLLVCTFAFFIFLSKTFILGNWRSIFFLVVSSFPPLFYSAQVLKAIDINSNHNDLLGIEGYVACVSTNPSTSPPPCPVDYFPGYQFDIFVLAGVLFCWPLVVCFVIYFSKPHIWRFWSCQKAKRKGSKTSQKSNDGPRAEF